MKLMIFRDVARCRNWLEISINVSESLLSVRKSSFRMFFPMLVTLTRFERRSPQGAKSDPRCGVPKKTMPAVALRIEV